MSPRSNAAVKKPRSGNGKPKSQAKLGPRPVTLYERLGGAAAIDAAVANFYQRVLSDQQLAHFFESTDMNWLKKSQTEFLTQALGGPSLYKGASMESAHAALGITEEDFNRVAGHLVATLQGLGVPQPLVDEVVALVAPLAPQIVTKKS